MKYRFHPLCLIIGLVSCTWGISAFAYMDDSTRKTDTTSTTTTVTTGKDTTAAPGATDNTTMTTQTHTMEAGATTTAGQSGMSLTATLMNKDAKAAHKSATVEVQVKGVSLIDPDKAGAQPSRTQGHLHYQLDNGPVIATPVTKLSFHNLSSGQHTIVVMLASSDHTPLGPQETLTVTIP